MADRYGRDFGGYGGRDYGGYGGLDEDEDERRERYRQGLDYRGPYDVTSRRGGSGRGREDEGRMSDGRGYASDYGRGPARGEESDYGGGYGRDLGRDLGRDYGRGYPREYGRGSAREDDERGERRYGRERFYGDPADARTHDYGRGYEGRYGRGYDYDDEEDLRDYRREGERGHGGRGEQTDYGRTSSRFFEGGGYATRHGRGYDYEDDDRERRRYDEDEEARGGGGGRSRGWLDQVSDEVASWFGDREAARRRRLDEKRARRRGRGPKNYRRSDERIREDVNDRLSDQDYLDASEIEVVVSGGEVTLSGTVETRYDKRLAEDIAESVSGVTQVQNNLRVVYRGDPAARTDETTVIAARPAATAGPTDDVTMTAATNTATSDATTGTTSDPPDIGGQSSSATGNR